MQDSELQFLGAWTRILCPSIWKEIELPAWAAGVAISSAARTKKLFHVSLLVQRACELARTLGPANARFRDLRHPGDAAAAGCVRRPGTVIQITSGAAARALVFRTTIER